MKKKTHTKLPWGVVDPSNSRPFSISRHVDITPNPEAIIYRPIAMLTWNEVDEERGDHHIQKANAEFIVKACNTHYPMLKALVDLYVAVTGKDVEVIQFPNSAFRSVLEMEEIIESARLILEEAGVDTDVLDSRDEALSNLGAATKEGL